MDERDVENLIIDAQAGDAVAEDKILHKYAGLVKSVAFSYYVASSDIDREDLVQEGMIALMRAVRTYKAGDATFWTYASRCVKNAMIDEIRKHKVDEPTLSIEEVDEAASYPAPSIEDLAEAISSVLTENEKQALELRMEAKRYQDIAAELGVTKKKVDNLIASAKRKLKTFFEH